MRLPHYLTLSPAGVFHFRLRVPPSHRQALGREIRHSLRTREPHTAQLAAQVFAQRYALAFREARAVDAKKLIEEAERAALASGTMERYKVSLPGFEFEASGAAEHRQVLDMLRATRAVIAPQAAPAAAPPAVPAAPRCLMREAVRRYERILQQQPMPRKTRSQKLRAVASFYASTGASTVLADITRADVGRWIDTLRQRGNATPTLRNKVSYLGGFFADAQAAGLYPRGENPAQGAVAYGTREKRNRRNEGFQFAPFKPEQIAALFAPEAFAALSPAARWGAVLGLYTGARVSEIAQAEVADFIERDKMLCLSINASGLGKSLKTERSARLVPLHPDLLALGLPDRLATLRAAGVRRFFGERGTVSKTNGAGSWLSKAWSYYLARRGVSGDESGKKGFHSFRSTLTQRLQDAQVPAERRAALLGHDLADVHYTSYSRKPTIQELAETLETGILTGLDLEALRLLLTESDDHLTPPGA